MTKRNDLELRAMCSENNGVSTSHIVYTEGYSKVGLIVGSLHPQASILQSQKNC